MKKSTMFLNILAVLASLISQLSFTIDKGIIAQLESKHPGMTYTEISLSNGATTSRLTVLQEISETSASCTVPGVTLGLLADGVPHKKSSPICTISSGLAINLRNLTG